MLLWYALNVGGNSFPSLEALEIHELRPREISEGFALIITYHNFDREGVLCAIGPISHASACLN